MTWWCTSLSKTFERTRSIDIGLVSDTLKVGPLALGIGVILATSQASGNVDVTIQEFITSVKGPAIRSATGFRSLAGIWSGPVDVSERIDLISLRTSSYSTWREVNDLSPIGHGCKLSTKFSRYSFPSTSAFPVVRWATSAKCLLSSLTSRRKGCEHGSKYGV